MSWSLVSFEQRREKILSVSRSQSMSSCRLASMVLREERRKVYYDLSRNEERREHFYLIKNTSQSETRDMALGNEE